LNLIKSEIKSFVVCRLSFVVYGLLLKVAEPISGPDSSGAVSICGYLREKVDLGKEGLGNLRKILKIWSLNVFTDKNLRKKYN
jgi:hypothetical protein